MSKKNKNQEGQVEEVVNNEGQVVVQELDKKAKKALANKRWAERRAEAAPRVVAFLKENKEQLGKAYDDIAIFVMSYMKGPKTTRTHIPGTPSINSELKAMLNKGPVTEEEIFKAFKIGRPEMKLKIRAFILAPKPEDRIWVELDEVAGSYSIVGKVTEPENWNGYRPTSPTNSMPKDGQL